MVGIGMSRSVSTDSVKLRQGPHTPPSVAEQGSRSPLSGSSSPVHPSTGEERAVPPLALGKASPLGRWDVGKAHSPRGAGAVERVNPHVSRGAVTERGGREGGVERVGQEGIFPASYVYCIAAERAEGALEGSTPRRETRSELTALGSLTRQHRSTSNVLAHLAVELASPRTTSPLNPNAASPTRAGESSTQPADTETKNLKSAAQALHRPTLHASAQALHRPTLHASVTGGSVTGRGGSRMLRSQSSIQGPGAAHSVQWAAQLLVRTHADDLVDEISQVRGGQRYLVHIEFLGF